MSDRTVPVAYIEQCLNALHDSPVSFMNVMRELVEDCKEGDHE